MEGSGVVVVEVVVEVEVVAGVVAAAVVRSDPPEGADPPGGAADADPPDAEAGLLACSRASASVVVEGGLGAAPNLRQRIE